MGRDWRFREIFILAHTHTHIYNDKIETRTSGLIVSALLFRAGHERHGWTYSPLLFSPFLGAATRVAGILSHRGSNLKGQCVQLPVVCSVCLVDRGGLAITNRVACEIPRKGCSGETCLSPSLESRLGFSSLLSLPPGGGNAISDFQLPFLLDYLLPDDPLREF